MITTTIHDNNNNNNDNDYGSNRLDKINTKKQLQLDSMIISKAMLELISTVSSLDAWSSRIFDIE